MVFEKLYKFIGKDIKSMMERPEGHYCLRLHKQRVYYVSEALMKKATNVSCAGHHAVTEEKLLCLTKLGGCSCSDSSKISRCLLGSDPLSVCSCCQAQVADNSVRTPAAVPQIARDKLVSLGTPVGKLTHSGKFRLTVGALDVLSRYAKHKVGGACSCHAFEQA